MLPVLIQRLIDQTIAIQQIPAPTFFESQRAAYIHNRFLEEQLREVSIDPSGNVYGRLPGNLPGIHSSSPLIICAHLDTVFPADTPLDIRREAGRLYGPGIGDNSLGVAGLFGLLWSLRNRNVKLSRDLWLVANVCEEGLGNLNGIRAVVDRFGAQVQAYILLEGMALGHLYHRGLGVQRYRVDVHTPGGHSWVNYGAPSAIHELAALINHLTELSLPQQPRTTLNVGVMAGGTTVNTIAADAHFEMDLRSESPAVLAKLTRQVMALITQANRPDVQVTCQLIGERPAGEIAEGHWLVQMAKACLSDQGLAASFDIGSTDANLPLSRGLPAICLGLTTGAGAHTVNEYIDLEPLEKGIYQLACLVESVSAYQAN